MTYKILCDTSDRAAWLKIRNLGVGASESAVLLGESHWGSPLKLFAQKSGFIPDDDGDAPEYFEIAQEMEPTIQRLFQKRTGLVTFRWQECLQSVEHPFMLATPDSFTAGENGVRIPVELKFVGQAHEADWEAGVPCYYETQVLHQKIVVGAPYGYIGVLSGFGGRAKFMWGKVDANPEKEARIIEACRDFMRRVAANDPPYPTGTDADDEALKRLYPGGVEEDVALPGVLIDVDEEYQRVKAEGEALKVREKELKQTIQAALGNASRGVLPNGVAYTLSRSEVAARVQQVKAYTFTTLRRKAPKER